MKSKKTFRHGNTGNKKIPTCLETLLQNKLNSDVARFTTNQTCLANNQAVKGCEKLLQKV